MSSRGNIGAGMQIIPAASKKMVQSLKEVVGCPEPEIYAMLKECNMDPNEAVNRLLSQDPFHEVKSKRERKKENKHTTESKSRGSYNHSSRGGRGGSDQYFGRSGLTQFSASESGTLHGKSAYKKENGSALYASPSPVPFGTSGNHIYCQPPVHSDSATENKATTPGIVDGGWSSSVSSSGFSLPSGNQSTWSGVPGQVSMADIVKMGRPQGKASNTTTQSQSGVYPHYVQAPQSNLSHHALSFSENSVSKVSPDDEWPLDEHPPARISPVVEPPVASDWHTDPHLSSDRIEQHPVFQQEEVPAAEDASLDSISANHAGYVSVSSARIQMINSEDNYRPNNDMNENMDPYQPRSNAIEHREFEDVGVSISSVTSNLQQLNVLDDLEPPSEEDDGAVIIPNHLQVQTADCLHLSFGSFRSLSAGPASSGPFSSMPSQSNMEEASVEEDAPSVGHLDTRNPEYNENESFRTVSDGNLVHRTGASAAAYDSTSVSQSEVLKQENHEGEAQCMFPSSSSNYNFENGPQLDASFPHSQASSQMQTFSNQQAYANSLPSSLLGGSIQSARESEYSYLPFSMAQSMHAKYGNTVSSVSSHAISMPEALKAAGFSSTLPAPQTLSGNNIATGPALPQHLPMHPYSQLGPFANMIGYPFVPPSYTYLPSAFQQAFAGNSSYHQSLGAVLPQYKNSTSVSSLPQSAAVASGYGGGFGSSTSIPSNFLMNQPSAPGSTTVGYADVLSSQYKDGSHLLSLQQNENQAMWVQGPGSRTMSAISPNTYYGYQGQSQQQPSGFRQNQQPSQNYGALGNSNLYHSQAGMLLEHQQQNPRDSSIVASQVQANKQSPQQLWQNSY